MTLTLGTTTKHQIEYKIGENGTYADYPTEGITVNTNDSVYVRLKDTAGQTGEEKEIPIDNIDNIAPEGVNVEVTVTTNSITVKGTATDRANDGARLGIAGNKTHIHSY